jgi:hypothetical protein
MIACILLKQSLVIVYALAICFLAFDKFESNNNL